MARKLSDVMVRKLKAPKKIKIIFDTAATGFALKLMPNGRKVWVLHLAFPGHARQTNRLIGEYPDMTLADARAKAVAWYSLVKAGIDPAVQERQQAEAKAKADALAQSTTLASVVEAYGQRKLSKQRQGAAVLRRLEVEVLPSLGSRPVAQISQGEITAVIEKVLDKTKTGARARNVLADLKGLYGFVLDRPDTYGLDHAPTDRIKPARLIGKKTIRQRVLSNDELRALWAATAQVSYPYGSLVRMIMLTGCRVSELRCASWREVDLATKTFTISAARFKSGCVHVVPLSDAALTLLGGLPRGHGDYVFSNLGGSKPVSRDKAVRVVNEALGGAPGYTLHDIRRTVRTRLTPLTSYEVAEAVIGHAKTGLNKTYNLYEYLPEKTAALQAWADTLLDIVQPINGDNVEPMPRCA